MIPPTEKGGPRPDRPLLDGNRCSGEQDDRTSCLDEDQEEYCTCRRYGDFEDTHGCPVHDTRPYRESDC